MKHRNVLPALLRAFVALAATTSFAHAATQTLAPDSFAAVRARHAGEPLVVHIWGMTCVPCVKELPQWGALLKAQPGLHLVLVQVDESSLPRTERRLKDAGLANVESWTVKEDPDEFMRASIDPQWTGDMPRTLLVGADGSIQRIQGSADFVQVKRWLAAQRGGRK
jgi:thiol-disulfide isomerase/thioredoxin